MKIRLLAVDLDGTLLNSRWELSDANRDALREANSRGVQIAVVTGRRYTITRPITDSFGFHHFVITSAGASVRSSLGNHLFQHLLRRDLVGEILKCAQEFRSCTFLISSAEGQGEIVCQTLQETNPHAERYIRANRQYMRWENDIKEIAFENILQIVLMGSVDAMREAARQIESCPGRSELTVLRTEYPKRDFALLDILDGRINKGLALAELAGSLGIGREEVMAVGDNYNDLDMLKFAGTPVVMENADDEVKSKGWPITGTNDADGVAEAIGRYILSV